VGRTAAIGSNAESRPVWAAAEQKGIAMIGSAVQGSGLASPVIERKMQDHVLGYNFWRGALKSADIHRAAERSAVAIEIRRHLCQICACINGQTARQKAQVRQGIVSLVSHDLLSPAGL